MRVSVKNFASSPQGSEVDVSASRAEALGDLAPAMAFIDVSSKRTTCTHQIDELMVMIIQQKSDPYLCSISDLLNDR